VSRDDVKGARTEAVDLLVEGRCPLSTAEPLVEGRLVGVARIRADVSQSCGAEDTGGVSCDEHGKQDFACRLICA
jgi:hypothetical protein